MLPHHHQGTKVQGGAGQSHLESQKLSNQVILKRKISTLVNYTFIFVYIYDHIAEKNAEALHKYDIKIV